MFENYDEILTIEQVMGMLCIGKNTAYKLLKSGELKGFLLSNKWRIPRLALEKFILSKWCPESKESLR